MIEKTLKVGDVVVHKKTSICFKFSRHRQNSCI